MTTNSGYRRSSSLDHLISRCRIIFFFQAEGGIRDVAVTGVRRVLFRSKEKVTPVSQEVTLPRLRVPAATLRSEERRVGKEWRCRGAQWHEKIGGDIRATRRR